MKSWLDETQEKEKGKEERRKGKTGRRGEKEMKGQGRWKGRFFAFKKPLARKCLNQQRQGGKPEFKDLREEDQEVARQIQQGRPPVWGCWL